MKNARIDVQPLPYESRQRTFLFLVLIFLVSLPFLYLYATGYRFDFKKPTNLVSTGGIYVAVDGAGAEIYIDGELVRETRTFRKAFYAQSLDVGTHRLHVQKEGFHTWVKELPVSKRLVTEAEAFNLPVVPQVRVISEWHTATGSMVVLDMPVHASSTNALYATTTTATSTFVHNPEFITLRHNFGTTTDADNVSEKNKKTLPFADILDNASSTVDLTVATTTRISNGVELSLSGDDLYATWVGPFEQMPYYYCAPDFPPYSEGTTSLPEALVLEEEEVVLPEVVDETESFVIHPVQTVPLDVACDPSIRIDRRGEHIEDFDFFPGSADFVVLSLKDGIYMVEIDDRSWQNVQPLMHGSNLQFHIESNNIYVYDGSLIYQVVLLSE